MVVAVSLAVVLEEDFDVLRHVKRIRRAPPRV